MSEQNTIVKAGLIRRLAAIAYDSLLLVAVLMFATAIITPLTGGESIKAGNPLFTGYLFIVCYFFFAWFWLHGGQTIGMRSWKIRLQETNGHRITLWHALLRFITGLPAWLCFLMGGIALALDQVPDVHQSLSWLFLLPKGVLFGIGCLWLVVDNKLFLWRDKFSDTVVVRTK